MPSDAQAFGPAGAREDILVYAEEASSLLGGLDGADLRKDRRSLLAVTRAVEIVGDAANQLTPEIATTIPFDFRPAIAMRHRLIHGYDSASADIIAQTIKDDFPGLIAAVRTALASRLADEP